MQAVVVAGGLGTRLGPLTARTPKPLLPLMGIPFAYGLIRQLAEADVTSVTLLIGCRWPVPPDVELTAGTQAVHATAQVASSAQIGPIAVIGAGCVVEPGASVVGSVLHDDVRVGAGAQIVGSVLGRSTRIAPGTQITGRLMAADS